MMTTNISWRVRLSQVLLGAVLLLALVVVGGTHAGNEPMHMTTDWSHKHVLFSPPHNLGQHFQLLSNPRYVQQLIRRNSGNQGDPGGWRWHRAPEPGVEPLQGDWSMDMGAGAHIAEGNYPAKYSFDPTTAKCGSDPNPDYVVYNTSLAGSQASAAASQTVTFGTNAGTPSGRTVI